MAGLIQWVKNLIFIILFTALLEMFLPDNSMRKYVRVVMGFFIITVLISPLMAIFNQDTLIMKNFIPDRIIEDNWEDIQKQGHKIESSNQNLLMDYYQEKISKRVQEVVNLNYDNYRQEISVKLDKNYRLESIKVVLFDPGINKVEIEAVNIGRVNNSKSSSLNNSNDTEISGGVILKDGLAYKLSQVFQIPRENIEIIIKKGG